MRRFRVVKAVLVVLGAIVAVVFVGSLSMRAFGAMKLRSATARYEREDGSLSLLSFVRHRIPVEENSVTWLRPGVLAVVLFPTDRALVGSLAAKPASTWTPDELAKIETLLERNQPAFEILSRARGLTASDWEIPYQNGNQAKIPDLLAAINAAKLLSTRGRLALAHGDRETAVATAEILGALAKSHERESLTIVLLIGVAIERVQLGLVQEIATSPAIDRDTLDRLREALCDEDLAAGFRRTLRGEAASLRRELDSDEYLDRLPRVIPRALVAGLADLAAAAALEGRLEFADFTGPIRAPIASEDAEREKAGWWRKLVMLYGPNIGNAAARGVAVSSARTLTRLALGLRRDALVNGSFPPSLEPPIDPLSGEPFVYRVASSGAAEIRSTTTVEILRSIYAVGVPTYEGLYAWSLPAPSRPTTRTPSPPSPRGANPS